MAKYQIINTSHPTILSWDRLYPSAIIESENAELALKLHADELNESEGIASYNFSYDKDVDVARAYYNVNGCYRVITAEKVKG